MKKRQQGGEEAKAPRRTVKGSNKPPSRLERGFRGPANKTVKKREERLKKMKL